MQPDLIAADAVHCPFRDAAFDVVLNHHVLPHLLAPGRAALLRECARVLVRDGALSVEVFGVNDLRFGKGEEVEPGTFRRGSGILVHHFRADELRAAVVDAGFAVAAERETVRTKLYAGRQVQRSILSVVARKTVP
jgi:SAM-dependent methyltransferase